MRALEAIRSFICYPDLDVKILSSHGGLTAAVDGVTHQATENIAAMSQIPNMRVLCPADPVSARACVKTSFSVHGPVFNRLMRGALSSAGITADVIDLYSIKPYDREAVLRSIHKTGALVVAENHQAKNGVGYELAHLSLTEHPVPFANLGLQDTFGESGAYRMLIEKHGLSAHHIEEAARHVIDRKRPG